MKLLFVLENYLPHVGGVETVFRNLAEGLIKQGHAVDVVTHKLKGTQSFEVINGVRVHRVSCFGSRYLFTFFAIPKALSLAKDCDIIHTTTFNGAPPAWLAFKLRKRPVVITVHEVWTGVWNKLADMGSFSSFIHNILEKAIYKISYNKYICVSHATKKQLLKLKIPESAISVVYNGMDYSHFNPEKYDAAEIRERYCLQDDFIYLAYGRPGISKGYSYLLEAVPQISNKLFNAKLILILSREKQYKKHYQKLIALIKNLSIQDKVLLLPPQPWDKLPAFIKAADCVVVPSLSEGFGYNIVEANAMGVPVVASDIASIPEVISGSYILVEPRNPKAIADAVISVSKGKNIQFSEKKVFGWKTNLDGYLKVYEELLPKRILQ